jgi:hypothetical protein
VAIFSADDVEEVETSPTPRPNGSGHHAPGHQPAASPTVCRLTARLEDEVLRAEQALRDGDYPAAQISIARARRAADLRSEHMLPNHLTT